MDINEFANDLTTRLQKNLDVTQGVIRLREITPLKYWGLNSTERFEVNTLISLLDFAGAIDSQEEYKRLERTEKTYKFLYVSREGLEVYFENAKEVKCFFGCSNHKIWAQVRDGLFRGRFERVNDTFYFDKDGNLLSVKKGKVH